MEALYTKYRPKVFADVIGQEHIKQTLQNEIKQDRLAHAYLFCGPRGIAKTTSARILAKAVNCEKRKKGKSEPCTTCNNCKSIQEGNSLDLIEIDAASHTGVDNVRENIIESSHVAPSKSPYKVFIIDEVHMLSLSAFNALLKLLEEPPSHAIYILATTEVHKIPDTIISRCQRFDFKKIDQQTMVKRLQKLVEAEGKTVDELVIQRIARRSQGHVRDAESILSQILSIGKKVGTKSAEIVLPKTYETDIWVFIQQLDQEPKVNLEYLDTLMNEGLNTIEFSKGLIEFVRQLLLIKASKKLDNTCGLDVDQETFKEILDWLKGRTVNELIEMLELFMAVEKQVRSDTYIMQLPLEIAVLKLSKEFKKTKNKDAEEEEEEEIEEVEKKQEVKVAKTVPETKKQPEEIKEKAVEKVEIKKEAPTTPNIPKTVEKKVEVSNKNLTEEKVQGKWELIVSKLKAESQPLAMTLNMGSVQKIEGNAVIVEFAYEFHAEYIGEVKAKRTVEEIMGQVLKTKISLQTVVNSEKKKKKEPVEEVQKKEKDVEEALDVFGGQVVG